MLWHKQVAVPLARTGNQLRQSRNWKYFAGKISRRCFGASAGEERFKPLGQVRVSVSLEKNTASLAFETGGIAPLTDGAAVIRHGSNTLLATACSDYTPPEERKNSLSLVVEFRAKAAAAGQVPSHVLRRELGPREEDIVVARMIDRALRPLFEPTFLDATQVICTTLSYDHETADMPVLAVNAASAALCLSEGIRWNGPVGCVRVGKLEKSDNFSLLKRSMSPEEMAEEGIDFGLVIAATRTGVVMMDLSSSQPVELEEWKSAMEFATPHINAIISAQEELVTATSANREVQSKPNWLDFEIEDSREEDDASTQALFKRARDALEASPLADYASAAEGIKPSLVDELLIAGADTSNNFGSDEEKQSGSTQEDGLASVSESEFPAEKSLAGNSADLADAELQRKASLLADSLLVAAERDLLVHGKRRDKRAADAIRELGLSLSMFSSVHGSCIFSLGKTSTLCSVTFGRAKDSLRLFPYCGPPREKRFLLQYELPPFSLKEVGRLGLTRRMIGNGDLAERALVPLLPSFDELPYTIRVTNETLHYDGSSSMASVCASSAALLSCGVNLKEPVVGVSMGLIISGKQEESIVLTDVTATEEEMSDLEFKVAGTWSGFTAAQMGARPSSGPIPLDVLFDVMDQSHLAKFCMLNEVSNLGGTSLKSFPENAPQHHVLKFENGEARRLIGTGGSIVRALELELNVEIDIDPDLDIVWIYSKEKETMESALEKIRNILWEPSVGEVFDDCEVVEVQPFGAVVSFSEHGRDGWLHISEFDVKRLDSLVGVVKVGDRLQLQVVKLENGRVRFSRRALMLRNPAAPKSRLPKRNRMLRSIKSNLVESASQDPEPVESRKTLNVGGDVAPPPPLRSDLRKTSLRSSPPPPPPPPIPSDADGPAFASYDPDSDMLRRLFNLKKENSTSRSSPDDVAKDKIKK